MWRGGRPLPQGPAREARDDRRVPDHRGVLVHAEGRGRRCAGLREAGRQEPEPGSRPLSEERRDRRRVAGAAEFGTLEGFRTSRDGLLAAKPRYARRAYLPAARFSRAAYVLSSGAVCSTGNPASAQPATATRPKLSRSPPKPPRMSTTLV